MNLKMTLKIVSCSFRPLLDVAFLACLLHDVDDAVFQIQLVVGCYGDRSARIRCDDPGNCLTTF